MNKLFLKVGAIVLGAGLVVGSGVAIAAHKESFRVAKADSTTTLNFSTTTQCTEASGTALVYSDGSIKLAAAKAGAGTATNNYYPGTSGKTYTSTRFYTNSNIEITSANSTTRYITGITFTATSDSYATALKNSTWTNGTSASSGTTVTVTPSTNVTSVSATIGGTAGITQCVVTWSTSPATSPVLNLSETSLSVATTTSKTLGVSFANLSADISVTQSSSNSGSVLLSCGSTTDQSSLTISKSSTSPASVTVKGNASGDVTLTFASGTLSKTCTVNVAAPTIFKKITQTASIKDGGRFIIVATSEGVAFSKTQLSNGRDKAVADFVGDDVHLPAASDIAVLTLEQGTGSYAGYYTIYDPDYVYNTNVGGYVEYYKSQQKISTYHTDNPNSDDYYWQLSFEDGHALINSKSDDTLYLEYNKSYSYFRAYAKSQTKVDLYELAADIPSDTALTSITAANASVGEGSTIRYSGSYAPTNATETISVSLGGSSAASVGTVSMSNGTFSFDITGGTVSSDTNVSMTISGANGTVSETVTLTVADYTATHTLVTAASSLSNGAKVVFATQLLPEESTDAPKYAVSGAAHTGGNFLPVTQTAFNSTKTDLAKAENTQEFTIWCVDSVNHYYVLSDGGYFMAAASSKNNYLVRSDQLNEQCYFTIVDDTTGIVLKSVYAAEQHWQYNSEDVDYTVQYNYNNGSNSRFALYRAESQTVASLYKSNSAVNKVQGFVDAFMHFGNAAHNPLDPDGGACKESGKGYFRDALAAYDDLSDSEREAFCTQSAYANAFARLSAWASANGYEFSGYSIVESANGMRFINGNGNNVALIVIVSSSIAVISAVALVFVLKRKKHN